MTVSGARAKRVEKFEFEYPPVKFTVNEQSAVCVTEKDWDRYNAYVRALQNLCEE